MICARRHFYGTCAVLLGAWESAAFAGRCPTITTTVRARAWRKLVAAAWLLGLARHLLADAADELAS